MDAIGLTTWSEHPHLLPNLKKLALRDYAEVFPIVELDTFFYGLKAPSVTEKWALQVPEEFKFILKVPRELTWQTELAVNQTYEQLFQDFLKTIAPIQQRGKVGGILLQFPPDFTLTETTLNYLKFARKQLPELPILLELRHRSWYRPEFQRSLVTLLRELQITIANIDEPDVGEESVPLVPLITTPQLSFWRFHGRNAENWAKKGFGSKKGRTLYRYSEPELVELAEKVQQVSRQVDRNYIIFNNNANFDAADNALRFSELLGLNYRAPGDEQLDLF
ncbi:hypothetical protein FC15_GL000376 [Lapidilactobacillus concavus DSM 17758]|uniref:DUF72 domain-containing protein n=1 Tax=Lapidilactobacillus concavus DSM 17758 TaxID=1423735 RepID=A0A0R1VSC6_9LACO|nr:DUF72 domain-containing protein [Lapidilactobacillus concavus]KRM08638.1 hypothetical protein FC15_GL000376 [Lapidilactobacillus concavus DSM 17758]GEL13142.1 hypothetical protein LCO01nite_06910 [Lapidilactobacillus concavus]